jgi:kumamolisin
MVDGADRVPLRGSERRPLRGATRISDVPGDDGVTVTVRLRRRSDAPALTTPTDLAALPPQAQPRLSREEFAGQYGADQQDVDRVNSFAGQHGLQVIDTDLARRTVEVTGSAAAMRSAFGVDLGRYEADGVSYRGREGAVQVPADLEDVIEGVFGLDDRPQAHPRLKRHRKRPAQAHPFMPQQVAQLYSFPQTAADGECVGIIELGGGYRDAELGKYFTDAGLRPPTVVSVPVGRGRNHPGQDADGEVLLDVEVVGAVATGVTIAVYFAENTDQGFLNALTTAVHDTTNRPSAISISWGAPELQWTPAAMSSFDAACADAATLGVTVLAAAGDHGAGDGAGDGGVHADFPASSPHVLACGGTQLQGSGAQITSETVWNDNDGWATGGGVSAVFDLPAWQQDVGIPVSLNPDRRVGRGLPDIAGNADSLSGYEILVDGQMGVIGGTSAVAPLYSALTALLNAQIGTSVGYLNPILYRLHATAGVFRDITSGDNSVPKSQFGPATSGYPAGSGWDACTGLGSIHGTALLSALQQPAPAAVPGQRPNVQPVTPV